MSPAVRGLPVYRSHKMVRAAKIAQIEPRWDAGGATLLLDVGAVGFAPVLVEEGWVTKHAPEAGGYFVAYEDGYTSYSPAKAFEEGYARIGSGPAETAEGSR